MNSIHYAADLAETSPRKSVGVLRLAAAVGFVLLSTAFTVHSFVVSTEPWQPAEPSGSQGLSADSLQEDTLHWNVTSDCPASEPASGSVSGEIELSLVSPECADCRVELIRIVPACNEG